MGFSDRELVDLRKALEKDHVSSPTADDNLIEKKDRALALWVRPKLVIERRERAIAAAGLQDLSSGQNAEFASWLTALCGAESCELAQYFGETTIAL